MRKMIVLKALFPARFVRKK